MNNLHSNHLAKRLTRFPVLCLTLIFVGLIGIYLSTIIQNPYTLLYPPALITAPLLMYVFEHMSEDRRDMRPIINSKIIMCSFFILFSSLTLYYHLVGFWRTDYVFYATFSLHIIAALYILTKPHPGLGLLVIFISGISNRLTAYYGSALYNGVDIYGHSHDAQVIASNGSLEVFATNKYFYAPFYHILSASGELIYGVPIRDAIALTVLLAVTILPTLIVYLISSRFWSTQVGLIAALLYITSDHAIRWGIHVSTTSLGIVFFSLLLLSLVKYVCWKDRRQYLLVIVFVSFLMFTHQVSLFIGITTIGTLALSMMIFQKYISRTSITLGLLAGLTVYIDSTVTLYKGPAGEESFLDVVVGSLVVSLMTTGTEIQSGVTFPKDPSISPTGAAALTLPHVAGSALLLTLAIVGALYWLSERRTDKGLFVGLGLSVIVAVLLIITLSGPAIGLRNLMPTRWWPFTYILLSILAAPGLVVILKGGSEMLSHITKNRASVNVAVVLLVIMVPYVALMGGNYAGGYDDPLLDRAHGAERYGIQEDEKRGFIHLSRYTTDDQLILSDQRGMSLLSRYYGVDANTITVEYGNIESIRSPSILFDREYLSTKHVQYNIRIDQETTRVHGSFETNKIPPKQRSTIYNNGDNRMLYLT